MPDVVILLGGPGSGKGTTAERVRDQLCYKHVSTGDMLREAVKNGTEIGLEAEAYMKRGELVPDDVMIKVVAERLNRGKSADKYLLDGFPRTLEQAELLEQTLKSIGGKITHVLLLDAPRELLIKRLCGRRICKECGMNFHIETMKPKQDGICDACGGELYQRSDDHESTIKNRLDVYSRQTKGLISHYEGQGILNKVYSGGPVDELVRTVTGILTSGR